jgi:3-mercaptopyruvate sulfurtransferase SseA
MFDTFKSLCGLGDNRQLTDAIHNDAFLVDIRTPDEFSKGSVESAVNIPLNEVGNQLPKFKNKENIVVFLPKWNEQRPCQKGFGTEWI